MGRSRQRGIFGDPAPVPQEPEEKADPSRLRILVAGRPLTLMEYLEILRLSSGHGTTLLVALVLLVLLFEWMAIGDAALGGNDALMSATFLLVMVSSLLLLLGVVWSRLRTDRKRRLAYSTMMADPAAVQGRKLEFYDDRIESVSARGTSVIPFADVTAYIETMRVIALVSGDRCIYIRGQDLTAYDAGLIRSFLRTRVPAKLVRIKAPLIPCLYDPLPIPVFSNCDEVLARACIPYTKQAEAYPYPAVSVCPAGGAADAAGPGDGDGPVCRPDQLVSARCRGLFYGFYRCVSARGSGSPCLRAPETRG